MIKNKSTAENENNNEDNNTWPCWKYPEELRYKLITVIYIKKWSPKTISALNKISFQKIRHFKKHYTVGLYSNKNTLKGIQPKKNLKVTQNQINLVSKFKDI